MLAASVVTCLSVPNPLLTRSPTSIEQRLFPPGPTRTPATVTRGSDGTLSLRPPGGGTLAIHSDGKGCIAIGQSLPVCHRHLRCALGPDGSARSEYGVEVFAGARPGTYLVMTGTCNSACCDDAGLAIADSGARLDDGSIDRVWLRLDAWGLGALLLGLIGLAAAALRRTWRAQLLSLGLLLAAFELWRTL
jgi:hypothetical protein